MPGQARMLQTQRLPLPVADAACIDALFDLYQRIQPEQADIPLYAARTRENTFTMSFTNASLASLIR
jgi:hypothetical protein